MKTLTETRTNQLDAIKNRIDAILLKYKKSDTRCCKIKALGENLRNQECEYYVNCTYNDIDFTIVIYHNDYYVENYRPIYI